MRSAQFTLHEIVGLFRRRRKLLIIPALLMTALCAVGAYLMSNKYESSTTILVQRDEILNPLISFEMAVTTASEDRLRTFNEIIYSRSTIQKMIDSLGLGSKVKSEDQRQGLVEAVTHNITTERRGSDSFRITYLDTDPIRAQRAAALLTNLFITTLLGVERERNERAVTFFENKLDDIRQKFESSQKQVVSMLGSRVNSLPTESKSAYIQVEAVEKQLREFDDRVEGERDALKTLRTFPAALQTDAGKQSLYDLSRLDLPFAADLKALLTKYDEFLRRYTPEYPEVQKLERQVAELIDRMRAGLESQIDKEQPRRAELEKRRADLVDAIKQSSINERYDEDKESDYGIYRKLYDEMKVKLEQAKTTRDLGSKGASQFIIIDPPLVPTHPAKPNRMLIIIGGFGLGLFLGFLTIIFKELLDTTIRAPRDIAVYQKPVIAFITDGGRKQLN